MQNEEIEIRLENADMIYNVFGNWTNEVDFKLTCNDPFDFKNTYGTTLELTKTSEPDVYKVNKVIEPSNFTTRRFLLNNSLKESEYRIIGDEVMKIGGFWEVIFGGYAMVNIPKGSTFNLDEILELLPQPLTEITDN